jgi:anti-sigma B factor antagonist
MVRPTQFKIERQPLPEQGHRLSVSGELDLATTPQLEQQARALLADGARSIVIDLADLSFIDSTGLRLLLVLSQQAADEGWRLLITRPSEQVQTILKITGTGAELPIEDASSADVQGEH